MVYSKKLFVVAGIDFTVYWDIRSVDDKNHNYVGSYEIVLESAVNKDVRVIYLQFRDAEERVKEEIFVNDMISNRKPLKGVFFLNMPNLNSFDSFSKVTLVLKHETSE